jgi:hypothetical protein
MDGFEVVGMSDVCGRSRFKNVFFLTFAGDFRREDMQAFHSEIDTMLSESSGQIVIIAFLRITTTPPPKELRREIAEFQTKIRRRVLIFVSVADQSDFLLAIAMMVRTGLGFLNPKQMPSKIVRQDHEAIALIRYDVEASKEQLEQAFALARQTLPPPATAATSPA